MATSRFIDGTGFNAGTYGPPYTLGKSYERTYELTVFSRIWGIDHYEYTETGAQIPIPKSYKVKVDIGMMGSWVMLSIDECLHPLHALTRPQNTPPEKAARKVGETWYEYPWAKTDGVWKDSEIDAFPDRIYFDEMLPKEILQYGNMASQHSVPLAEYKYNLDYIAEDKWMVNPGVQDTMGKLVITDTGEMEIWGNFDWEVTKTTKYKDGDTEKYSYSNEVVMTHGFQTHWPSDKYSKPAKTADQEDYYVGFHSFSLIFKLNTDTYGDRIVNGYIDPKELPTKATECNRITKNGLNLDKLHNVYAETIITKDDKENKIITTKDSGEEGVLGDDCLIDCSQIPMIYCNYDTQDVVDITLDDLQVGDEIILTIRSSEIENLQKEDDNKAKIAVEQLQLGTQRIK